MTATVIAVALFCFGGYAVTRLSEPTSRTPESDRRAVVVTRAFLDRYVARDGRVVRHDQGGDTVSEGQAYAMLAAVAIEDERRFRLVWSWTRRHLMRGDGLLFWSWSEGRVADRQSASDADLDAARALLIAGRRFRDARLVRHGRRLARAVVRHETTMLGRGRRVLLAGPWARERMVVNPSYAAPRTYELLREATRGREWEQLGRDARMVASDATALLPGLPSDWGVIDNGGMLKPTGAPGAGTPPVFGYDAQRLLVRFSESCRPQNQLVAARLWPWFREQDQSSTLVATWTLDGKPLTTNTHPLTLVAAAAASLAAGDQKASESLLTRAETLDSERPTYYGAAWVALGRLMLTTGRLDSCPPDALQA